jgi:hypothetical protein
VSDDGNIYHCPVCGKPFDMDDKLADFALAAHQKDHGHSLRPGRDPGRRGGRSRLGGRISDLAEGTGDMIGNAFGKIVDRILD